MQHPGVILQSAGRLLIRQPSRPFRRKLTAAAAGANFDRTGRTPLTPPPRVHLTPQDRPGVSRRRSMVTITQTKTNELDMTSSSAEPSPVAAAAQSNADQTGGSTINITASCAARIKELASTRPNPDSVYLRLYVDAGGCSGFQYKFLLLSEDGEVDEDEEEDGTIDPEEDVVFFMDGTRVVVDQTSLDLLNGSTIDYVQEMIRSSFAVLGNPQSESACGCGSSFAIKNFGANPALD
mmetsp:Transcript_22147/g.50277  ORF Transcript_22147/g.50277 Transcript_22147/m.50277 type:complete len:237 (+) Transcript_22147:159-869(+)